VSPARIGRPPGRPGLLDHPFADPGDPTCSTSGSAVSSPITPVGCPPPTPPRLIAPNPASTTPAPTSPPIRAWLELDGRPPPPREQIPGRRGRQGSADHLDRLRSRHLHDRGDGVGHRSSQQQRPEQVEHRGQGDRGAWAGASGSHQRRDRVGGVMEAVGERKRQGGHDRQPERRLHAGDPPPRQARIIAGARTTKVRSGRRRGRHGAPGRGAVKPAGRTGWTPSRRERPAARS
jgi:hypothetical protein